MNQLHRVTHHIMFSCPISSGWPQIAIGRWSKKIKGIVLIKDFLQQSNNISNICTTSADFNRTLKINFIELTMHGSPFHYVGCLILQADFVGDFLTGKNPIQPSALKIHLSIPKCNTKISQPWKRGRQQNQEMVFILTYQPQFQRGMNGEMRREQAEKQNDTRSVSVRCL